MDILRYSKTMVSIVSATILLGGCSLKEYKVEVIKQKTSNQYIDISHYGQSSKIQNEVFSQSGLLAATRTGLTYFHVKDNKPLHPVGYGNDISYFTSQTIDTNVTDEYMNEVKDKIIDLYAKASNYIEAQIDTIKIEKDKDGNLIIPEIKQNKQLETFQSNFNEVAKSIKEKGLFLHTWNNNGNKNQNNQLNTGVFGYGENNKDIITINSGYSLFAGLKISTLFVGEDLLNTWARIDSDISKANDTTARVTTLTLHTKKALPFSITSYKTSLQNKLELKLGELINIDSNIKSIIKGKLTAEMESLLNQVDTIGTIGFVSGMKPELFPLPVATSNYKDNKIKTMKNFIEAKGEWTDSLDGWAPIYKVDTNVLRIKSWFNYDDKTKKLK